MHMVISPGVISSYRVDEQRRFCKYFSQQKRLAQEAYTVPVATLTFKVIQGEWFSCCLKANVRLPISD